MRVSTLNYHRIAIGKAEWPLFEGRTFSISSKQIELERPLKISEYLSGQCFGASDCTMSSTSAPRNNPGLSRQFAPLKINHPLAPRPTVPESEQAIPMRPGDLLSTTQDPSQQKEHQGSADGGSHWTANWYAPLSSVLVLLRSVYHRRKHQIKKHKTWDGDAYISIFGEKLVMVSEDGIL
jgi:DNA repair and recombination protein RAD54B